MALIFISHRMEEIFQIADKATVLRSGKTVGAADLKETSEEELVGLMIEGGGAPRHIEKPAEAAVEKAVLLETEDLSLVGAGRSKLAARGGRDPGPRWSAGTGAAGPPARPFRGRSALGDRPARGRERPLLSPPAGDAEGPRFRPRRPGRRGPSPIRSILENLLLPSWSRYGAFLNVRRARKDSEDVSKDLRLKMGSLEDPVSSLSGGNAQKVVLGNG